MDKVLVILKYIGAFDFDEGLMRVLVLSAAG